MELLRIILYYPFVNLLAFFTWIIPGHNVAWGIILLTLFVRLILLVPTRHQAESQRKMMQINPLLEDLKKEYADDKQGLAVAQMELYKKNNINPFGNCLMGLIQLPILIVLYQAIVHGLAANNPHLYPWMPRPDHFSSNFFGIDLLKPDATFILPVLAAAAQYLQMRMMLPKEAPVGADGQPTNDSFIRTQRMMSYTLPVMTLLIAKRFPAGVAIYWVVTTLFSVAQQYRVNKKKFEIAGVKKVIAEADKEHPEYHRPAAVEKEILEESSNKGVTVKVRRKNRS